MFFVVFESSEHAEAGAISAKFYEKLQNILQGFSGFIDETSFTSLENQDRDVLIATFEDEAAARRWREYPSHVRIQKAAREKVFIDYRVRAGPQVQLESLLEADSSSSTDSILMLIELMTNHDETTSVHLRMSPEVESSISNISSYQSDNKQIHLITWTSNRAAFEYAQSVRIDPSSLVYCIKVARDYGKTNREEAP